MKKLTYLHYYRQLVTKQSPHFRDIVSSLCFEQRTGWRYYYLNIKSKLRWLALYYNNSIGKDKNLSDIPFLNIKDFKEE